VRVQKVISDDLRRAFIVYILSHKRSMAEVLALQLNDLLHKYETGFVGMSMEPVRLDELYAARADLLAQMVGAMPAEYRRSLLSFKAGEPNWGLLDVAGAQDLPAVPWKLDNLAKLPNDRRAKLLSALESAIAL
jgi:hypothetical protein